MTDSVLTVLHLWLVFGMLAVIAMEIALLRGGASAQGLRQLARIDGGYGLECVVGRRRYACNLGRQRLRRSPPQPLLLAEDGGVHRIGLASVFAALLARYSGFTGF